MGSRRGGRVSHGGSRSGLRRVPRVGILSGCDLLPRAPVASGRFFDFGVAIVARLRPRSALSAPLRGSSLWGGVVRWARVRPLRVCREHWGAGPVSATSSPRCPRRALGGLRPRSMLVLLDLRHVGPSVPRAFGRDRSCVSWVGYYHHIDIESKKTSRADLPDRYALPPSGPLDDAATASSSRRSRASLILSYADARISRDDV